MLPLGHSSAGLIISQFKKPRLKLSEVIFVVISANIFDLDLIFLFLFQRPLFIHHRLATHTPVFGVLYFLIFFVFFRKKFSKKTFILSALAMLGHLVLDSVSFLIYPSIVNHQIAWLYPFYDPRNIIDNNLLSLSANNYKTKISTVKNYYLIQTPLVLYAEISLFITSVLLTYKNHFKHDKEN